jgi:Viral BACON domain
VVATVSVGGLLTAAVEGNLDVSATYQNRTGSIHADVRKPGCEATLSPPSLTYGPFGGGASVQVATTLSDCRWTAKSDAAWLPFNYDPGRSGTGSFGYSVPGNSTPEERTANIVISIAGGPTVVHKISQEKPVGCSYVVSPARITLPSTGGIGVFDVATTPGDCQWTARNNGSSGSVPITLTSPASGRGAGQISYKTASNPFTFDLTYTIEIAGLSGLNPAGVHTVTISKR